MHQARIIFHRLHEIRLQCVLEQRRHCTVGIEITYRDGFVVTRIADDDVAETILEVLEVGGQAEDGHDLGRHGDIETRFTNDAVVVTAETGRDAAQRAIVHVHDPAPRDAPRIDVELVLPVHVIVDQRRQQVVGSANGMKVAREMQVDIGHGHDLGIAAAGRAAFHAEARPQAGFAQADQCIPAKQVHGVAETDRRRGLALAGRRWRHGRHEDQLAVLALAIAGDEAGADLGLVMPVGDQFLSRDAEPVGNVLDRFERRRTGDLDIAFNSHFSPLLIVLSWPGFYSNSRFKGRLRSCGLSLQSNRRNTVRRLHRLRT